MATFLGGSWYQASDDRGDHYGPAGAAIDNRTYRTSGKSGYSNHLRHSLDNDVYVYADKRPFTHTESVSVYGRETGKPIPYSRELASYILKEVKCAFNTPNPYTYDPTPIGYPTVDGEVKRFICALAAYNDSRAQGIIPLQELIMHIPERNFADTLKKRRFKTLLNSFDATLLAEDEELNETTGYLVEDIAEVFNPRFWLFWEQPDPCDEKWAHEPIEPIDPDLLRRYEEAVDTVTPETCDAVMGEEILLQVTGSGCIASNNRSSKVYLEKHNAKSNNFSKEPLKAKLVYVQKCPGDSRRASVLSVPQSNTIKWFEKQCSIIAADTRDSIYGLSDIEFERRYRRFKNSHTHFLCRDIKKDGITKNRELVMATLRVLKRKYPNCPVFDYIDIYSNWFYYLAEEPGVLHNPPRGVGLGMSSAITTILQAAVRRLVTDELWEVEGHVEGVITALFYHDDATIGFDSEGTLLNYDSVETSMFQKLGLIKNLKKSFHATEFVLCEEYSKFNDKKHYQLNLLYAPFHACNIVQAKVMVQQLTLFETKFDLRDFIPLYAQYWGFEFTKEETKLPFTLGGWIPSSYGGVDTSFLYYDDEQAVLHQSLLWASLNQTIEGILDKKDLKDKTPYNSPLKQLYGELLDTNGKDAVMNYDIPLDKLKRKMANFTRDGTQVEAWGRLMMKRYKVFNKNMERNVPLSKTKTYQYYCDDKGFCDVLPPQGLFPEPEIRDYEDDVGRETHRILPTANPTLSYLAYYNPSAHKLQNIIPSPVPPTVSGFRLDKMSNAQRKSLVTGQDILVGTHYLMGREYVPIGDHYNFLSLKWIDPYTVASAWCAHTLEMRIPNPPVTTSSDWVELNKYRKSNFHMFLTHSKYADSFKVCVRRLGWNRMKNPIFMLDETWEMIEEELVSLGQQPKIPDSKIDYSVMYGQIQDAVEGIRDVIEVQGASTIIRDYFSNGNDTTSTYSLDDEENARFWSEFGSGDHMSDLDTDRGSDTDQGSEPIGIIMSGDSTDSSISNDSTGSMPVHDHG